MAVPLQIGLDLSVVTVVIASPNATSGLAIANGSAVVPLQRLGARLALVHARGLVPVPEDSCPLGWWRNRGSLATPG